MCETAMLRDVFISRAEAKFPGRFDYSQFEYKNVRHVSTVVCCKHGPFQACPGNHLYANGGCVKCDRENWLFDFVARAIARFGTKFNYDKFEYVSATAKSTIGCPEHGEFEQSFDKHLQSAHGCPVCANAARAAGKRGSVHPNPKARLSAADYLARFKAKHGDKYELDLSGYNGISAGIVTLRCKEHGSTEYTPGALLMSRHACRKCGLAVCR